MVPLVLEGFVRKIHSARSLRGEWSGDVYSMCLRSVKKVLPVLGGFDQSNYKTERLWATAEDGTRVPISLVYRPDMVQKDGNNPCLLYACAYKISQTRVRL